MKKKILYKVLAASVLAAALGVSVSSTPVNAHEQTVLKASNTQTKDTTYLRGFTDEMISEGTFEYGGLSYTCSGSQITANTCANPGAVTELILYEYINTAKVAHYESLSEYTNLTDVILVANSISSSMISVLSGLSSGVNLYIGGTCNLGEVFSTLPCENIYFLPEYVTYNDTTSDDFKNYIGTSHVKHIYYNNFFEKYCSLESITGLTNADSESIVISKAESPYPDYVFYPFTSFDPKVPMYACEGAYYGPSSGTVKSMSALTFKASNIDTRIEDYVSETATCGANLDTNHEYGKVYLSNMTSYDCTNLIADEVDICTLNQSFDVSKYSKVKAIRFVKNLNYMSMADTLLSEDSLLEKIYIPSSGKDYYSALISRSDLSGLIEYYDLNSYELPSISYIGADETVYKVTDTSYKIDEYESFRETLNDLGIETNSSTSLLDLMNYYEFPTKTDLVDNYSLRDFTTILVPKNISPADVLKEFKTVIILNNGAICDTEDVTITIDSTGYTEGTDGRISIVVTAPNGQTFTKEVNVTVMDTDANVAYVLNDRDIYVVANQTEETVSLETLMSTYEEVYLDGVDLTYTQSPILDTTYPTYNAGNEYESSTANGRIKVLVAQDSLTGEEIPDTPVEEGYVVKEIDSIYTPSSIDGTRLIAALRGELVTYNGEASDKSFAILTSPYTNQENYTFIMSCTFSDTFSYSKEVPVNIINSDYKMGFVKFKDGTIAVIYNWDTNYTQTEVTSGLTTFMTSQGINSTNLVIPTLTNETKTWHGTNGDSDLIIINSGYNTYYTNSTTPVDQTELMKGYVVMDQIIYTKGYTVEQVLRALGANLLLKDGNPVDDYEVTYTTKDSIVSYEFKDGKEVLKSGRLYLKEVESDFKFILARAFEFDTAHIIVEKQEKEMNTNTFMQAVVSSFRSTFSPFTTNTKVDFTKADTTNIKGVYQYANGSYYSYDFNLEVVNLEQEIQGNKVTIDGVKEEGLSAVDKAKDFFDEFKDKFENNNVFKTFSIIIGSLLGIVLFHVIYIIFKKIYKWLRK